MNEITANSDGSGLRICVLVARWNMFITKKLTEGATSQLRERGVVEDDITVAWVPGSFELPTAASWAAKSGDFDAIICIGTVIRGETTHYELVSEGAANVIAQVALETGVPVVFGVIATENAEQAMERAGGKHGHKGEEAAQTAIEMANLRATLSDSS